MVRGRARGRDRGMGWAAGDVRPLSSPCPRSQRRCARHGGHPFFAAPIDSETRPTDDLDAPVVVGDHVCRPRGHGARPERARRPRPPDWRRPRPRAMGGQSTRRRHRHHQTGCRAHRTRTQIRSVGSTTRRRADGEAREGSSRRMSSATDHALSRRHHLSNIKSRPARLTRPTVHVWVQRRRLA